MSKALRISISGKFNDSISAGRSRSSLIHSISNVRLFSVLFSNLSSSHVAALIPSVCATTLVILGTFAWGFQSIFCASVHYIEDDTYTIKLKTLHTASK